MDENFSKKLTIGTYLRNWTESLKLCFSNFCEYPYQITCANVSWFGLPNHLEMNKIGLHLTKWEAKSELNPNPQRDLWVPNPEY